MKILTLSTSSSTTYLTLWELNLDTSTVKSINEVYDQLEIISKNIDTKFSILENLSTLFDKTVNNDNYELIIIDKGPGSFTGIRTGIAFAKGLTINSVIPVRTVSILDAIGFQKYYLKPQSKIISQINAHNNNVYTNTLIFNKEGNIDNSTRNITNLKKDSSFEEVNMTTIKSLTAIGIFDFIKNGTELPEKIIPLYGNPVNISKPKNEKI
ncbi:MAG TPA: hypothetical protein PK957_02855 [Candidatus Dojkabacteria bacterium]|nr:hypothetical protein [Candidatus Dojkabacteria bacterium]HQF36923.1 hypothetical protein [Candidatus Dojkabacteria bacterium]